MPNEDRTNGPTDEHQPEHQGGNGQEANGEEAPLFVLPIPSPYAAWIQFCLARDLATWTPARACNLSRCDALVFAQMIYDALPDKLRTPIEGRESRPKR